MGKLRRSYLYLLNENDLKIYQYERKPNLFFKGVLRTSWFNLDTTQENLDNIIESLMKAYLENKEINLTLGSNPYEYYIFKHNELEQLILDFILAKEYFEILNEIKKLKEEFLNNDNNIKIEYLNFYSYEFKSKKLTLYNVLLKNREITNKLNDIWDFEFLEFNAIKKFKEIKEVVSKQVNKEI